MTALLRPADMNPAFADAYNTGRVEAFLALYEPGAVLIDRSGESTVGWRRSGSSSRACCGSAGE
jgi:hypothetical protein